MKNNQAKRQRNLGRAPRLVGSRNKGDLRLIAKPDSPDQNNVVGLLRYGVGSVLEGLTEAKDKVRDAKRLHEIAASVGDDEVEAMIGHELRQVEVAAKVSA